MGAGRTELLTALYGTGLGGRLGRRRRGRRQARQAGLDPRRAARGPRLRHRRPARRRPDAAHAGRPQSRHVGAATASRRSASCPAAREAERRERSFEAVRHPAARPRDRRRRAVGRQPAESRARQGSARRAADCCCSTSRRAASTSAPRAKSTRACANSPAQGLGVLVASSEMPELLGLCDRIVVLRGGPHGRGISGGVDEHTRAGGGGRRGERPESAEV